MNKTQVSQFSEKPAKLQNLKNEKSFSQKERFDQHMLDYFHRRQKKAESKAKKQSTTKQSDFEN